jgi:hypothetical protein
MAAPATSEPLPDIMIGRVILPVSSKLDAKATKELAAIAAKIKKTRKKGTVKITGDIPSAASQDEYIAKAVFMARSVESKLKSLLPGRYQIFITAAKYGGEKRTGSNSVEIRLYPYELGIEGRGFSSTQATTEEQFQDPAPVSKLPSEPASHPSAQSALLTPPQDDYGQVEVSSKKERLKIEAEDHVRANELVLRAKARAAEKAKRLQQ